MYKVPLRTVALNNTCTRVSFSFLQAVIAGTEQKNAQIYYEMYRKGQESAKFERNFEVTLCWS